LVKRGELALPAPHGMIEAMAELRQKLTALKVELNELRARCDAAFHKVSLEHADAVACKTGCHDCCHALFDLAPMEVLALAIAFKQLPRNERREALRRAEKAAQIYDETALKVLAAKEDQRLKLLSQARVPCPLLNKGRCILYAERPATCRLYGIPVAIQGNDQAALNRLTIAIEVTFTNKIDENYSFTGTSFSRYVDYSSSQNLTEVQDGLIEEINQMLVEDVFNKAVVNW